MGKKIKVKGSRPHRRNKHKVKGYSRKTSKPHRNKPHKRSARRTDVQIKKAEKRRKKESKKSKKTQKKKTQFQFTLKGKRGKLKLGEKKRVKKGN